MLPVIKIHFLTIPVWITSVIIGVVICWLLLLTRTTRLGYPTKKIYIWALISFPIGAGGAFITNIFVSFMASAEFDALFAGDAVNGLTSLGGIVFCLLFSFVYIRKIIKVPILPLLDAVAFSLPLSIFFGRFGCLMIGDDFGRMAPIWAQDSPISALLISVKSFASYSLAGKYYALEPDSTMIWNLPLLFMINAIFVLVYTEYVYRRKEQWSLLPGTVSAITATGYFGGRFFLEFLREEILIWGTLFNPWQRV